MKKNNRKKWIINKNFQYRFILMCIIPMLLTVICFWLGVEIIFFRMIAMAKNMGIPEGHVYYKLLVLQKSEFNFVIIVSSLVVSFIFSLWAIVFSHRIAGPIYRLTQHFKGLKKNENNHFPHVRFRKGDFFIEVENEINNFFDRNSN